VLGASPDESSSKYQSVLEYQKKLDRALVNQQEKLFELWHQARDGTLTRCEFQLLAQEIRTSLKSLLQDTAEHQIGSKEKTPLAKTVRTCRQLLKVEPALWLFVTVEGVEPTNNAYPLEPYVLR
jgi:hypothetical protein